MRVIVPYTDLQPGVVEAIEHQGYEPECLDTSKDIFAYSEAFQSVWEHGQGFVNVEHDIVVPEGSLASLEGCETGWCAIPYETQAGMTVSLGCAKFSSALLRSESSLLWSLPRVDWSSFDASVLHGLKSIGERVHIHDFVATHVKPFRFTVSKTEEQDLLMYIVDVVRQEDLAEGSNADAVILLDADTPLDESAVSDHFFNGTQAGMRFLKCPDV